MIAELFLEIKQLLFFLHLWLENYPDLREKILYELQSRESENILHDKFSTFFFKVLLHLITNYGQRNATFLEFISKDDLHVSGGFSAHLQEHITVHTASGIVNQYCC
jgi:hypothetical protein